MCGIVGYTGKNDAENVLLKGLSCLQYRGYDSAGIAVQGENGRIAVIRAEGKLQQLVQKVEAQAPLCGMCGIGHTRWATHGAPDEHNAHPHSSPDGRIALVHNGIIENHGALRAALIRDGYAFRSETDSESAVLLLHQCYEARRALPLRERALAAIRAMTAQLQGSYALAMLFENDPGAVYAARMNSPLIIGRCVEGGFIIASDAQALLGTASEALYMENGDVARMDRTACTLYDAEGRTVQRPFAPLAWRVQDVQKDGYDHFMRKEIDEQPSAVRRTLDACVQHAGAHFVLKEAADDVLAGVKQVLFLGCGSAYYAGVVGALAVESDARLPAQVQLASEFRYRPGVLLPGTLAVVVSQSGETADSLAALRLCRTCGVRTLAVVNVPGSSIAREADAVLMTQAGPEIAVATTKAYAAQLAALELVALRLAALRGTLKEGNVQEHLRGMKALPEQIAQAIALEAQVRPIAREISDCRDAFFIGRGLDAAIAMEGSLKLKEATGVHAEAYAAGELKHGAISLIAPGVPVIAVATQEAVLGKMLANMAEVRARGARVIAVTTFAPDVMEGAADRVIRLPGVPPQLAAFVAAPALQLLAYHMGCERGLDVDKPRNLAKSVTVE